MVYLAVPSVTRKGQYNRFPDGLKCRQPVQGELQKNRFAASLAQKSPSLPFVTFTVYCEGFGQNPPLPNVEDKKGFCLVPYNHRGNWRTMHCRLCINCYGTGS